MTPDQVFSKAIGKRSFAEACTFAAAQLGTDWPGLRRELKRRFRPKRIRRDWEGCAVRSLVPLANQLGEVPRGTIFEVRRWSKGLSLRTGSCACCGLQFRVSRVQPSEVEWLGPWEDWREEGEPKGKRQPEVLG